MTSLINKQADLPANYHKESEGFPKSDNYPRSSQYLRLQSEGDVLPTVSVIRFPGHERQNIWVVPSMLL